MTRCQRRNIRKQCFSHCKAQYHPAYFVQHAAQRIPRQDSPEGAAMKLCKERGAGN